MEWKDTLAAYDAASADISTGDLTRASNMLTSQALTLDAVFTELLSRATKNIGQYLNTSRPGLGDTYATNYAANGGGAPQFVTTPQGTFMVPRSPMSATSSAPPAGIPNGAVSFLRSNPASAAQFDEKYGAGASAQYLQGGAAPQAPAPFVTP